MTPRHDTLILATALGALTVGFAFAEDAGEWKRGRIYYRAVCTSCHEAQAGGAISPASKTIQQWKDYLAADPGKAHVAQYVAQAYRQEIAPKSKVAKAFAKLPDAQMLADVEAFVLHGAKDSATPATCN